MSPLYLFATHAKSKHAQRLLYLKRPPSPLHGYVQGSRPCGVINPHTHPRFQSPSPLQLVVRAPSPHGLKTPARGVHCDRRRLVDDRSTCRRKRCKRISSAAGDSAAIVGNTLYSSFVSTIPATFFWQMSRSEVMLLSANTRYVASTVWISGDVHRCTLIWQ